jgi:hypothetical protein
MKVPRYRPWAFRKAIGDAHRGNPGPLCALLEDENEPIYAVDRRELAKLIRRAVPSSWGETKHVIAVPDTRANAIAGSRKELLYRAQRYLASAEHPEAENIDIEALDATMAKGG